MILNDANSISPQYSNLISLAARQTIGSTELTVARSTDGQWNTSDVKMFMKNVGGNDRWVVLACVSDCSQGMNQKDEPGRGSLRFFPTLFIPQRIMGRSTPCSPARISRFCPMDATICCS